MSKENNLTDFLTDLGSAIKDMRGTGEKINAQDYSKEVRAIEPLLDTLDITENGLYDVKNYKKASVTLKSEDFELIKKLIEKTGGNSITVPYGVTKIGYYAFMNSYTDNNYKQYYNYYLPATIQEIAPTSMEIYYDGSTKIYFGGTLEQWAKIPKGLLYNNDVTSFSNGSYTYNLYIDNVLVNEIIINSDPALAAFSKIKTTKVHITSNVKNLSNSCFYQTQINEITFDSNCEINEIPNYCFSSIKSLVTISLPKCNSIGSNAVSSNSNLEKIELQEGLTIINNYAFSSNSNLKEIKLPQTLTTIGERAFSSCSKLNELIIPKNVTSIGGSLHNNQNIVIVMESETPCTIASNTFMGYGNQKIYVPKGTSATYKSATNWSKFSNFIYEKYNVVTNIPTALVNNETITYSIDGGKTYQTFTNGVLTTTDVATIKIKSTDSSQTILIGTTAGGNDVGTISNSELTFSFTTDTNVYLTIQ